MDVTSTSISINIQQYQSTTTTSSTQGMDNDGDNDGSRGGNAQGLSDATGSPAFNVQLSGAGQARHAHGPHHAHGPFNAQNFASKLDTSGLSSDQQQTLKDILAKYDGKQMDKNTMKQLVSDLKNAGLDVTKLFDNFRKPENQRVSGNSVSTLA